MVRETRYLLVGNLPENTTENEITEYFKRFGRIQKVKIERKQEEKEEKEEESQISTLTATVAFTDIKSASNAHKADKKLLNNTLTSEYSEGFGATGSVVTRSHEPDHFPRAAGFPANRKGFEEEADGFDVYYGTTSPFNESPYSGSSPFSDRGRPRERWPAGSTFPGRGAKWTPGTPRIYPTDSSSKDGFEKPKTSSSIPASSPTHSTSQSSEKHDKKKKKSKSVDRSRSSSGSSRSSSSSSESCSASSSKERPKSTITSAVQPRLETQDSVPGKETDIEPGEREPLGIYITKLPLRSSENGKKFTPLKEKAFENVEENRENADTSLRDGLFHEYKKYGKITAVQVSGVADTRFAIVSFKQAEDAAKALEASKDKRFFGTNIVVVAHEGLEVDDPEYGTPEQQLDEHSPKATRTLFLGNLEKDITIEELKEKLEKYGEILDVDVKRQGAISAYAFIQFTDITSVVRALRDLDGTTWGPSKLKVGFGKSMATSVIWLDNLAETVNEGFLYRQFVRFGGISHTVVDRVKRKGLVFFLNIESAQYALPEMRNRIWNGKKIHIDFASRDCQDSFFLKMEQTNQLRPGERPDQRWMQKQMQSEPFWDESVDAINTARRGSFTQVARGRGRFQRGRGVFRGRGTGSFEIGFSSGDEFTAGRRRQPDEFSQGSGGQYLDDDYEQELRDYGHSQRERRERTSQSPPGYEDIYYEAGSQSGREFDVYEKHRYTSYRSLSPGSDREMDTVEDEYKYKTRTPSDDRYYYKDKFYEESKSRDRSHSSDSETRFRLSSEIVRRSSRSRSPTMKHKRTKELPFSYRSQSPPTPTDDEPSYYLDSGSPSDFESAYRKYDYKKRLSSSAEGDKKSDIFSRTGLRKEIEAKSEERTSRKRSYDQLSPSRSDSVMRLERQHSRGSKSGSVLDYNDKQSAKELISKVNRLKSEVHERTFGKDSPSSGSSYGDVDTSNMSEAELAKLHREKQKLLDKLTQLDDTGHNSDSENLDTRRVVSKKARLDVSQSSLNKYLHKSDSLTKQEIKEKLKMIDSAQSSRKQLEALRKKELLREFKKSKSSDAKKDLLDYSDDEHLSVNSPHDLSGFMPKKRRKVEGESDRKSRSYRVRRDDEQGYSSDDEKDRRDLLHKQISAHSDLLSKSRSGSMDTHLEGDLLYSHSKDDSRRTSSGSDNNKDSGHSRRHRRKKDDHITPLIPLGDDDMPDPETSDPRGLCEKSNSPMVLPLPEFAQFIQFSPLPSPHRSPEYPDLPTKSSQDREADSATTAVDTGNTEQSPCFSPQSSSSKTHSPSQSPSGSGSDSKANTNSDSGELPLGFPTETEHPEASDENKPDSLDSLPDPTKLPTETKEDNDSFSDNNSDIENLSSENLSIDERIRRLDEKWSKAQAVVAASSHKIIPDVESVVNPSTSNVLGSLSVTPTTTMPLTVSSPNVSSIYSKYRIRKKNDPASSGGEKSEPSEIVQTVLSKSSIFDQDSRRLGQYGDSFDSKDTISGEDNVSPLPSVWSKLDNDKDSPMVTVPGSLMDRLGQTQNVSFPTLNVTTSLTNSILSSNKDTDSLNKSGLNLSDNFTPKSILNNSVDSYSANIDSKFELNKPSLEQKSILLNSDTSSASQKDLTDKIPPCNESVQKSPNFTESDKKTDSRAELTNSIDNSPKVEATQSDKICDNEVNNASAFSELSSKSDFVESNGLEKLGNPTEKSEQLSDSTPELNIEGEKRKTDVDKLNDTVNNLKTEGANKSENDTIMETSNDIKVQVESESCKKDPVKKEVKKDEKTESVGVKESRTAFDVDLFGMEGPIVHGKRKLEDTKSEKSSEKSASSGLKKESKKDADSSGVKDVLKTDQKPSVSEKPKSDKDKHSNKDSNKSEKSDSTKEPSSKKQKISKDKKTESSHKDDKKKSEKKETPHKSTSEKRDDKKEKEKEKHKSKSEKDKKETDKKSSKEKDSKDEKKEKEGKDEKKEKEGKDEKKKKSEKKEKEGKKEDKEKKEDKKEKHEEKKEKSDEKKVDKKESVSEKKVNLEEKTEKVEERKTDEKKDKHDEKKEKVEKKEKHEKKEKEKHEKKDNHKHKSPEKKSKSASKDDENKETPKESSVKDDKNEKKKEHKSSSSHKSKKVKEETSSKKSKDDHGEHKKKDESNNRNNKDSPDKSKDGNRKEPGTERKETNSEKGKEKESGEKCNDQKTKEKEKENKDKDPDISKSKSKANSSESSSKVSHNSLDSHPEKNKSGDRSGEDKKGEDKKEEKKNKESSSSKSSSQKSNSRDKSKDSQKKSSKSEKQSEKSTKSSDSKQETKDKSSEKDSKQEKKESPKKCSENGLTEEDLAIFAQFSDEPYLSMYDKVKRRSTDKKKKIEKETEEQKKLLSEYKRGAKKKDGKKSLSDITESSEASTDDEKLKKKTNPKTKKKFAFSSDESDSASETDMFDKKNKSKTVTKKPKRILDIYSSDSEEEEERMLKSPAKTPSSGNKLKKNEVVKDSEHHNFNFDSLSDSDHKTTSTRPAKPKTVSKSSKKASKSKESKTPAKTNGPNQKKNVGNFKPTKKKNISMKSLFSDDSDDSMLSDSDSDSDISGIMLSPKAKKKVDQKNDKDKKKLPKGSSIYTTSEDSLSDDDTRPPTPITSGNGGKSDGFTSDPDLYHKEPPKTKDMAKKNKKNIDSSFITGIDSIKNKYSSDISDSRLLDKIEKDLEKDLFSPKKAKKQKSKDKGHKDEKKVLNDKKLTDSLTDDLNIIMANSKLDISDVYSETVYEKDNNKLFSNLTNKNNVQQIVSEHEVDQTLKYQIDSVKKDIVPVEEDVKSVKPLKTKNKKHKKENKKKKKVKDKDEKDSLKDKVDTCPSNVSDLKTEDENVLDVDDDDKLEKSENIKPDTDPETTATLNAVTRNLFEEMKEMKSTASDDKRKKKKKKDTHPVKEPQTKNEPKKFEPKVERLSDSYFFSDSDKKKDTKTMDKGNEENTEKVSPGKANKKADSNEDIFDFNEEEDSSFSKIKESHMKIIKPDAYDIKLSNDDDDDEQDTSNVPVEIQGVEIEYQSEDHEIKEDNICPVVEPSEVVIDQTTEEKIEKAKPKPRKRKGRKSSGRENDSSAEPDLTVEAVSSLEKEHRQADEIQTEVVHFDGPVSNEQELVIDEGVSLHVEDEASKAVESIVTDEHAIDETAKAVESILFGDEMATFTISEPVEPTPQLDQDYLQPEFAPGLPSGIPQIGNEVETTTASPVAKGRKGRKGRRSKSGQGGDLFANESSNADTTDIITAKQTSGNKFDYFDDASYASDISNLHDQNDDDDDGRLQIDFDPPKPEPKQKKQRKPRTPKTKLADAAALAAENKMPNLFGNFHPEPEQNKDNADGNRDSLSSENSELENAKHDDLLYMNREDQRHDSDMMSPDERSASEDTADGSKVKRRGRKPKNKDVNSMPIPRTNSPRSTRTTSPRSPRSADPRSPKFEITEPKSTAVKLPEETPDNKAGKLSSNVFDFDETDDTTTTQPSTTKQRKPRRKKGETMQSPDNRGLFSSPDRKSLDKLSVSSPEPKLPFGSPELNSQYNLGEKKMGLFSPPIQPEEPKLEVQNATVEEKGPPEPLFKAFFEGKTKENQKVNPLLAKKGAGKDKEGEGKLTSPLAPHSLMMSNVDKTIDDVSKGKFESTDDETKEESPVQGQKKRQQKKGKEEEAKLGMVKSPLKSPLPNHLNSPPPSTSSQPLVLPGMGLHNSPMSPPGLINKPGQTPLSPGMTNKLTPLQTPLSPAASGAKFDPLQKIGIQSPKPTLQSPKANQLSPKGLQSPKGTNVPQSPSRSQPLLSPTKVSTISTSGITTVVSTGPVVTTSPSSAVQDLRKADANPDGTPKPPMPGFMVPGISTAAGISVAKSGIVSSVISSTTVVPATVIDGQKKQQEIVAEHLQKQQFEQQRLAELELQRQQEHHIRLKEEELKQKREFQKQHLMAEQQAKLQQEQREEIKLMEQKKLLEDQQKKKMLQEHHKMLQQQYEELQRKQAMQAAAVVSSGNQLPPGLLSPGALPVPRPSLPSPNEGQGGQRPPSSVQQGPPFSLPGQHPGALPVRPGTIPPHFAQQMAMRQLVPPLDKPPTSAELELTHQQLQQHIAAQQAQQKAHAQAQQKAQAQALAEQQAQMAKHEAQQAQAQAKQMAQGKAGTPVLQQAQGKQSAAQQKKTTEAAKNAGQPNANNRKDLLLQRPPGHNVGVGILPPGKDAPAPGSQEAANQLTQQIRQQLAMSQANQQTGHTTQQHPIHGWPIHGIRPDVPRQPGPMPVTSEARISMPGPIPVLGGNPQQVQRVSPHPPTKSPTVAQTAPNMVHGFSQNQAATPRAPSPAVAKTAERQASGGGKWNSSPGSQRPGQADVRPRVPTSDAGAVRPEMWAGINGPANPATHAMPGAPRPAHQQPPSAHRQQPDHLHLTQGHGEMSTKDKFIHQQKQIQEFQRQQELMHQEMQRQHLREQALQAKAQKEVQLHKERERAESLEREKRERDSRTGLTAQSPSDPHHNPAIARMGYPFAEPRPPSRDGKMPPQSPAIVDPRDPRFTQQFPGHHATDLRLGSTTSSAFSPASGTADPHLLSNAELQRFQQNGMIPAGYGLRMLEPHLIGGPGHGPYMIPGLPLPPFMAAQQMDQAHLIDGRPPSRGSARPPSTQSIHTLSPTQAPGPDGRNQNRPGQAGPVAQTRDPHPGDGSLLNLLQRYPVMWQGVLGLKNDQCVVQMHFISGCQPLVKSSLPQQGPDGTVQPLRIAQRMRLEQTQLEGVAKRMQMEKDYCMMLALPCGRDTSDIYQQTKAMSTGFIQYLQQKQAAGIVNVADPGSQQPAYVVHIFPPCDFSQTTLSRLGFDLLYQVKDLAHLIVIIATVA